MPRKSPPKADEKPQFERFIEAATQAGADATDERLVPTIQAVASRARRRRERRSESAEAPSPRTASHQDVCDRQQPAIRASMPHLFLDSYTVKYQTLRWPIGKQLPE